MFDHAEYVAFFFSVDTRKPPYQIWMKSTDEMSIASSWISTYQAVVEFRDSTADKMNDMVHNSNYAPK
ncbi:hypothetical protein J23TS9_13490 [Paenibacillus sp. J23TS9]|nr:hypothetical protein J23TS9_13490 [Paenibacillus sp. J23TS9]